MRIGSSIGLIALGLIVALAININLRGIDLSLIGWILTAVGALGLLVSLALYWRNRPVIAQVRDPYGPGTDPYPPERYPRYWIKATEKHSEFLLLNRLGLAICSYTAAECW
jgi:Domain of unknown function (DUF6458)